VVVALVAVAVALDPSIYLYEKAGRKPGLFLFDLLWITELSLT
jgi:hypothetical protein